MQLAPNSSETLGVVGTEGGRADLMCLGVLAISRIIGNLLIRWWVAGGADGERCDIEALLWLLRLARFMGLGLKVSACRADEVRGTLR